MDKNQEKEFDQIQENGADQIQEKESSNKDIPEFRGLYKHVKISVKALDIIIVSCIVVIILAALL